MDEAAKFAHAEQQGIKKGMETGIEEEKMQLIRGMHKNGMLIEDIVKFTIINKLTNNTNGYIRWCYLLIIIIIQKTTI